MGWTKMSKCWEYRPIASLRKLLVVLRHTFLRLFTRYPHEWHQPIQEPFCGSFEQLLFFVIAMVDSFHTTLFLAFVLDFIFFSTLFIFMLQCLVGIEPLKVRHNATKLDLTVHLLSFWCIDIDLNIQPMSLRLYMIGCIWSSIKNTSHRFFVSR